MSNCKHHIVWTYCLFLCLLFPHISIAAPKLDISAKQQLVIAQGRGIATLPFIVKNNDQNGHDFTEKVDLPDGWRLLSELTTFHLKSGESRVRLVHIVSSSQTASGKYRIPYRVTARDVSSLQTEESINLLIPSSSHLEISIMEKPNLVISGENYSIKLHVKNKGNTSLNLTVKVKDDKSYTIGDTRSKLQLDPSQTKELILLIKTPVDIKQSFFHEILVTFSSGKLRFDKLVKTQIISKVPNGVGHYKKIPAQLKVDYLSSNNYSTLQTELSAKGYLDDDDKNYIDILIRNNQSNTISSLGANSEVRASYKNDNYSIHVGDGSYYLEGITTPYFYGRGIELEYHPANKPWIFKSYTSKQKSAYDDESQAAVEGAEFSYMIDDELTLTANIAQRTADDLSQSNSEHMTGMKLDWSKYSFFEIALSYAKDKDGQAYNIEQNGKIGSFYYDIYMEKADSKFDGSITDSKREELTTTYRFNNDKTYIKASSRRSRNNLDNNSQQKIGEYQTNRIGIGHYFSDNHQDQLYFELRDSTDKDKRENSSLDINQTAIRAEYRSNQDKWNISTALEEILTKDTIAKTQRKSIKTEISAAYTPTETLNLGFNIENHRQPNNNQANLSYGISAQYKISDYQQLSTHWRHNNNEHFQISYDYKFRNGTSLGLAASSETKTEYTTGDTSYRINFTIPFDAPIYRRKNIGTVSGRISDKKTGDPVENAIVNIDKYYAVSDKSGNYQFPSLNEGKNKISVDLSKSSQPNYLRDDMSTDELIIKARQSTQHNIPLLAGTSLEGQVIQYQAASGSILENKNSALIPSGGVDGLLITLTNLINNKKQYKQVTTQGGFFKFNAVPAGEWVADVSDPNNLLGDLRLDKVQKQIQLSLGNLQEVNFKAVPYVQKIKKIGPSSGFSVSGE